MEKEDFYLIQEMADAQKALDETLYKKGSKKATQLENNLSLMGVFGKWINQEKSHEEDNHTFIDGTTFIVADYFILDYLLDLWTIVLRSAEGRGTEDIRDWMLGKHLDMVWMNRQLTDTLYGFALHIIQYDPRAKLRGLVQLSELLGFSIELIHKEFMEFKEAQLSWINKEKEKK